MRGDIRGAAVSGLEPAGSRARFFSGISPCAGPWRYRHGGRGRRGGGTHSPSPVSHTPTILLLAGPHPTRASCRQATHPPLGTPTPPAPSVLLPRPQEGAGAVLAISGEQPCPGWSWCATVLWSSPGSPHVLDRGDIATGGGADGEGELVPPPLSPTLQPSYFSPAPTPPAPPAGRLPILLSASPTPPAWVRAIPMMVRDEPCPRELLASIPGKDRE